ncbi:MAG: UDP-N-acetylglucosamine 2-epimerase [Candidatus Peribacteraceae bacterium]|jgi:UDP-N-acetylglucosamine 2-epimerase (non-hydrolysing)/GDP/UDP-N,N'-diacetylbacillosamine 2-epimerase (hydrolysing)|nr:UDP-N-acetylglucosamine 2-epimerase [Candidatus Peribacteraceae bacterium]
MKKILAITGTRADYGIYVPVFRAIKARKELRLEVAVVGMHLKPEFGSTVEQIRRDGFNVVAEVDTLTLADTPASMAEFVGKTTTECARIFVERKPSLVLVLGDRGEQLAATVAATYCGIPVAQLHAGELSGSVDDPVRHAISELATIHCTSTEEDAERVRRMLGGRGRQVHCTGAPAIDTIISFSPVPKPELLGGVGLPPASPLLLFLQHPDTLDALSPEEQLKPSLKALESFEGSIMIVGSNADAGGVAMNEMLRGFVQKRKNARFVQSLPHAVYLSWMAAADVFVGNSSSGIIEAASFHLPVVNVGGRQQGRTRSGNVLDVPYDAKYIQHAIQTAISDTSFRAKLKQCKNLYGDGKAGGRIADILRTFLMEHPASSGYTA